MAPRKTRASSTTTTKRQAAAPRRRCQAATAPSTTSKTNPGTVDSDSAIPTQISSPSRILDNIESDSPKTTTGILSGRFLSQAKSTDQSALSKRLQLTWTTLQQLPNKQQRRDDAIIGDAQVAEQLNLVAAELVQHPIIEHQDPTVRSLVACCVVELLRVASPESPFCSDEALYRVFQLLLEQLRALATASTTTYYLYVLESLATVKSCALAVGCHFTMDKDEDEVLVQLVQALFTTIQRGHSLKIAHLMLSILVTCIEEAGAVEQPLLDTILSQLVSQAEAEERAGDVDDEAGGGSDAGGWSSCRLARELIQRTSDVLQNPLSTCLNSLLIDTTGQVLDSQKTAELKEHLDTLIYDVHTINPSLLLYVLPNVCLKLQADDVATRSGAVALMGKLFASPHADYGHQYMKNFCEFLGRFRDASKQIRMQMIQVCVTIWERKTDLASLLEKEFMLRLSDPEWEVRQLVVHELCDFAANRLGMISEMCLRAVAERMKDKKVTLRKETMTGLSQVYSTHISAYWELDEAEEKGVLSLSHHNVSAIDVKKLGWIPDYVLKCYAYPQQELKLRVIQLLDDFLLPKALSERARANGLLYIFQALDPTSREALRRIFRERAKCQKVCRHFVEFKVQQRQKERPTETENGALRENATQQLRKGLAPLFSDINGLDKLLDRLSTWKDHSVLKHLGVLCDYSKSQQEMRHARDQLVRCVGSKTPLGELLKKVCRKLSLLTLNRASVAALLDFLIAKEGRLSKEHRSVVDLIVMTSSELPELFAPFIHSKVPAILTQSKDDPIESESDEEDIVSKDPRVILGALHVLASYPHHRVVAPDGDDAPAADEERNMPSAALVDQLHSFCLGDSNVEAQKFNNAKESRAAELAASVLSRFNEGKDDLAGLVSKLCSKERIGCADNSGAAAALQSLGVFAKRCSYVFSEDGPLFLRLWTHLLNDLIGKGNQSSAPATPGSKARNHKGSRLPAIKLTEVRSLAIKVAVNLIVYCGPVRDSSTWLDEGVQLIKLLFGILHSDGTAYASAPSSCAKLRAAASCGLMKVMRIRQLEASMSVSEWHLLGFTMQDSNEDVRRKFLKKLTSHLIKHSVQHLHKYLSYLALAATDSNTGLKKVARNLLKVGVERMRRAFDAASVRESDEFSSPGQTGNDVRSMSALMVPEYALPYVIHLLAHHPAYPVKLVETTPSYTVMQSDQWSDQQTYLGFFLDGLVSANAAAADNIAFLLQILTKLSQCHDVSNPDDINIYPLLDSAVTLLKKKIKKQSNLKPFPGRIYLPKHLFSPGRPSTLATPGGRKEPEAPESLETTKAPRGPRLSTSLSPIKAMDIAAHFIKINSPCESSLLQSTVKKRKRQLLEADGSYSDAEEAKNDAEGARKLPTASSRRQSLLGSDRPRKRTYADDSSEIGAESDAHIGIQSHLAAN
uniref:Sister chromatid cohesion protein PDS5 n=1 Tax=Hyaloperonospora arabidopsidis (strain Emoy2) TaxID=559515 RepID=M4C1P7_HYAAE